MDRGESIAGILAERKGFERPDCDALGASLRWPIWRVRSGEREQVDGQVVLEEPLEIVVNGQPVAVIMRLPGHEKELAAGFCVSEGYARQAADILLIHHCGREHPAPGEDDLDALSSRNRVEMRVALEGPVQAERPAVVRLIRSGCGAADVSTLGEALPSISSDLCVPALTMLRLSAATRERQDAHAQVGGTHAAALFDTTGRAIAVYEDIGRHNAVDKVIGHCVLRGVALRDKILVTSGRASHEMVVKAVRMGIPVAASMSAPTSLAVELAEDRGLTLVGYLRGRRMDVYTHPHRITG